MKQFAPNTGVKRLDRSQSILIGIITTVVLASVVGVYLRYFSHAAGPALTIRVSTGMIAGGASVVSANDANGGKYIVFGSGAQNPTQPPPPPPPAASAPARLWGVQIHSVPPTDTTENLMRDLDAAKDLGATVVRAPISWRGVEWSGKGQYDERYLAGMDALMQGAYARGIKVIATIADTPTWASPGGTWNAIPTDMGGIGDFARFMTSRYKSQYPGVIAATEAWNEPNVSGNLLSSDVPRDYTAMVKSVYTGTKAGDPSVPVLAGSLSYADTGFMSQLYAKGIKGSYDGVAIHPYSDTSDPTNMNIVHSFKGGIESFHAAQTAAGDVTPLWITEFGWTTSSSAGGVTLQQQSDYSVAAYDVMKPYSYILAGTLYQIRDQKEDPASHEDNFGLMHNNFTQRPAYTTVKAKLPTMPRQ